MKLNQLKVLAAVARAGSIQRAARELHLSQPAVSKSIRELERQLGVPLLIRGADGVTLTPYGEVVAKRSRVIQKEVDKAREEIDWLRGEFGGHLSIGISPPAADALLANTLAGFHDIQPNIELQLLEQRPAQIIESLRNGALDIGIFHHYGDAHISDFQTQTLRSLQMVLTIGGHYTVNSVSIEQLCREEWLVSDLVDDPQGYALVLAQHFNVPPPVHIMRCTSVALCLELAPRLRRVSHWAETALPFLASNFAAGKVTLLKLEQPLPPMHVVLAYRDEELLSPAAALFVRMLRGQSAAGDNHRL